MTTESSTAPTAWRNRIVGSGEAWLTELSTAQIRELVALSADAVAES